MFTPMTTSSGTLAAPPVLPLPRPTDPRFASLLDHGRKVDPRGHLAHAWIAAVALGMQPLTPVTSWIGLAMLAGYAVLRLHATWRCLFLLLRLPLMQAWLGMCLWCLLAIAWSSDPSKGWDNAGVLRVTLLITACWPVVDRWRLLFFGMAAGSLVQTVFQCLMYAGVMENINQAYSAWGLTGGLSRHTGNTAVWAATSACLMFGIAIGDARFRGWAILMGIGCLVGVVLSGSRTLLLAVPAAAAVLGVAMLLRPSGSRRFVPVLLVGVLLGGVGIVSASLLLPGASPRTRLTNMISEIELAVVDRNYDSSGGLRYFWWREAIAMEGVNPVIGQGNGSFRTEFSRHLDTRRESSFPQKYAYTNNPHSTIVLEMIERGAVGLCLWAAIFGLGFTGAWRSMRRNPGGTGLVCGWIILLFYGFSNSLQLSGFTMSLAAVMVLFSLPRPPESGVVPRPEAEIL